MTRAIFLILALLPCAAGADPPSLCPVPPIPASEPPAAPLALGAAAPFEGILLSEARMTYYLCLDLRVKEAEGNVAARDEALKALEADYAKEKQRQINAGWFGRNGWWIGFVAGVVATSAVVWAVK